MSGKVRDNIRALPIKPRAPHPLDLYLLKDQLRGGPLERAPRWVPGWWILPLIACAAVAVGIGLGVVIGWQ